MRVGKREQEHTHGIIFYEKLKIFDRDKLRRSEDGKGGLGVGNEILGSWLTRSACHWSSSLESR